MFAHLKIGKEPKKVTMRSLLVKDTTVEGELRPNRSLLPPNAEGTEAADEAPGHYRFDLLDANYELLTFMFIVQLDFMFVIYHLALFRRITMEAWLKLVDLYGTDGPAIAVVCFLCGYIVNKNCLDLRVSYIMLFQKGIPYDDKERWRVFHDPSTIDVSLLPEPIIPDEEEGEGADGDKKKGKEDKKKDDKENKAKKQQLHQDSETFLDHPYPRLSIFVF